MSHAITEFERKLWSSCKISTLPDPKEDKWICKLLQLKQMFICAVLVFLFIDSIHADRISVLEMWQMKLNQSRCFTISKLKCNWPGLVRDYPSASKTTSMLTICKWISNGWIGLGLDILDFSHGADLLGSLHSRCICFSRCKALQLIWHCELKSFQA